MMNLHRLVTQQGRRAFCSITTKSNAGAKGKSRSQSALQYPHSPDSSTLPPHTCTGNAALSIQVRSFSDSGIFSSITNPIKQKLSERQERKKEEKMLEQIKRISELEKWTIQAFVSEVMASADDWRTKIPGMGNVQQVKMMKQQKEILESMAEELGGNAGTNEIEQLGRKEKLKISIKANISVADVNQMLSQFKNMEIMHLVLKKRKEQNKSIPSSEKELKRIIMQEAPKLLSKAQKKEIGQKQMKNKLRGAARR
mmetsp:Transcript_14702/g.22786  ORF Transcript_14702/g.22786 Transcript_14702/m.22786 type:complete len:255 (+) Transcript_14702:90-854(+)